MLELGPIQVTDILVALLGFFLIDLVRQLKALNAAVNSLKEAVAVEAVLRAELKNDIDQAHRLIRELQGDVNQMKVEIAKCPNS
jgi:hypothetical protein